MAVVAPMPSAKVPSARSGETGAAPEHACGVAEVANEIFDATRAARVPAFFLESLDAAEIDQGRAPRLVRLHAGRDALAHLTLQVVTHLGVHRRVGRVTTHQQPEPSKPTGHDVHAFSPDG